LGIVPLIAPLKIPFALLVSFVLFALSSRVFFDREGYLMVGDAFILLSLFVAFLYYVFKMASKGNSRLAIGSVEDMPNWRVSLKLIAGLVGIYFGGLWVVDGAVFIAGQFGLSEFLISATIIAIGTSLPELVVSVVAVMRGNVDLAVGNIVGSNIFNVTWVLGIVPLIAPLKIPAFVGFDIGVMFLATLLLFILMFVEGNYELRRRDGVVFVLFYILYVGFLITRG